MAANLADRSVMWVPWGAFLAAGAVAVADIRASSDAKPGILMLWLRSGKTNEQK